MSGIIAQNTLLSSGLIKSPAGGGAWNFISKQTASSDANLTFNGSIDSGSNYNVTKTTTSFEGYNIHVANAAYNTTTDLANIAKSVDCTTSPSVS